MSLSFDLHNPFNSPQEPPLSMALFTLTGAQSQILRSDYSQVDYRLDIYLPQGDAPMGGWPLMVLLDARGCFASCVEAIRRMGRRADATGAQDMVVVGISSPSADYDVPRRQQDFTSPKSGKPETGGAEPFLQFIQHQVKPLLAGLTSLDPQRQTLFGHSLAGYFTLWAMANHPTYFSRYAAISPSIWWDADLLKNALIAQDLSTQALLMLIGEWEEELPPWQATLPNSDEVRARRAARHMVPSAIALAQTLSDQMQDRITFRVLPEEDHASIVSAALPRALRLASLPSNTSPKDQE